MCVFRGRKLEAVRNRQRRNVIMVQRCDLELRSWMKCRSVGSVMESLLVMQTHVERRRGFM